MNKIIKVVLSVAVVIAIVGAYFFPKIQEIRNTGAQAVNTNQSECITQNGLDICRGKIPLTTATSTPCWFKTPTSTSTLEFASLQLAVGSSTATTWRAAIATSTSSFETATKIGSWSLGSGAVATFQASTTEATVIGNDDTGLVIPPNRYIGWKYTGASVGDPTKFTGSCSASFFVN